MNVIIYEDSANDIVIEVTKKRSQEMIDMLNGIKLGTNGPIYSKKNVTEVIQNTVNLHSILLKKSGEIIGVCGVSERMVKVGDQWVTGQYVRNFAVAKAHQGQGYSKLLMDHLKKYFVSILPEPYIGYAYIEGSNVRSQKVANFLGYPIVREFKTTLFSRLFPKKNKSVRKVKAEEQDKIKDLLNSFYKNYSFVQFYKTFYKDNFFVLEENGEIIAGAQAFKVEWNVHDIKGFSGKIMMNILPHIPIANRLFHPKFKFLIFDSLYCKAGKEEKLLTLFESILADFGDVYSAWVILDTKAPLTQKLDAINQWGILNAIQKPFVASVVMNVHGLSQNVFEKAKDQPAYISGFDCI